MSHFASGLWTNDYGPIPYIRDTKAGPTLNCQFIASQTMPASTQSGIGSTEGATKATFYAPSSGLYKVHVHMRALNNTFSGTTAKLITYATYSTGAPSDTSGTTVTNAVIGDTGDIKAPAVNSSYYHSGVFRVWKGANADSAVVVGTSPTYTGTGASGNFEVTTYLEKISD